MQFVLPRRRAALTSAILARFWSEFLPRRARSVDAVRMPLDPDLVAILTGSNLGTLATIRRDGRPQLSNVGHTYDPTTGVLRISVREPLAKTKNLRRDPRASYHVSSPDFRSWVVGEGIAELTPVATDPHDDTVEELIDVYRTIAGEHPDWDDYRAAMVREARVVVKLPITHVYGTA